MANIDPTAHPDQPARCPRRLFSATTGARCMALVLVRDADEHEQWHDGLDAALQAPVDVNAALEVAQWPEPATEAQPSSPYSPDVR